MEALAATFLLTSATITYCTAQWLHACAHNFAQSINDTQSAEAKAHGAEIIPFPVSSITHGEAA